MAASLETTATNFKSKRNMPLILALSVVVGGMAGVVYVLITSAMRSRREAEAG